MAEGTMHMQSEKRETKRAAAIQVGKTEGYNRHRYTACYCFPIIAHLTVCYNPQCVTNKQTKNFRQSVANCSGLFNPLARKSQLTVLKNACTEITKARKLAFNACLYINCHSIKIIRPTGKLFIYYYSL